MGQRRVTPLRLSLPARLDNQPRLGNQCHRGKQYLPPRANPECLGNPLHLPERQACLRPAQLHLPERRQELA